MTKEEAIKHGKDQLEIFGGEHKEFIIKAIQALESQQCEDCISREYLIDKIGDVDGLEGYDNSNLFAKHYMNLVKNAPSVQPQRKKAKWIDCEMDEEITIYRCSECNNYSLTEYPFCNRCGADMREVEE